MSMVAVALFGFICTSFTTEEKSRIVEDGGTGPYKAIMKEDASLKEHTILVPQDLSVFGKDQKLPVLVWGNGACTNSPLEHYKFLNEIASHGFIVLATGFIPMEEEAYRGPMSRTEQQIESRMPIRIHLIIIRSTRRISVWPVCRVAVCRHSSTVPIPVSAC